MARSVSWLCAAALVISSTAVATDFEPAVADSVIAAQNAALKAATEGKGFGPQSPRDIDRHAGRNGHAFSPSPAVDKMSLCDIHFHESAEHKGGEFTTFAGNGDGEGHGTGYEYDGRLTDAESAPLDERIGESENGDLAPGDTIEIHYVYSTAQGTLGNGLGTCLSEADENPQLRVEAVVAVLVNDRDAADFTELTRIEEIDGRNQAPNLPDDLGTPVVYDGSTTGPGYDEKGSPFEVTWSVRPRVIKLDVESVGDWLADNPFEENHAHGVRNLVTDLDLLSAID